MLSVSQKASYDHLRVFRNDTVEFWKASDLPSEVIEAITCDCPACQNRTIKECMEAYVTDEGGVDEANLRDFVRLHNAYMSSKEFVISQGMCKSRELKDYFKAKNGLTSFL